MANLDTSAGVAGFLNGLKTLQEGIRDGDPTAITNGVLSVNASVTGFLATYAAPVGESSVLPIYGLASTVAAETSAFGVAIGSGDLRAAAGALADIEISGLGAGGGALGAMYFSKGNPGSTILGASWGEPLFSAAVKGLDSTGLTSIHDGLRDIILPTLYQIKFPDEYSPNPYTYDGVRTGYTGALSGFDSPSQYVSPGTLGYDSAPAPGTVGPSPTSYGPNYGDAIPIAHICASPAPQAAQDHNSTPSPCHADLSQPESLRPPGSTRTKPASKRFGEIQPISRRGMTGGGAGHSAEPAGSAGFPGGEIFQSVAR